MLWIWLPSEKALTHSSGRSGQRFWVLSVPLHLQLHPYISTFIRQIDGVSCHPACLLMLHCALSRRVAKGTLQVPQDRLWLLREMAEATRYLIRSKSASTPRTLAVH